VSDGGESAFGHGQSPERKGFDVRLAEACTIEAVKTLIAEASAEARRARARGDAAGIMVAVAQRASAKRRGGVLLLAGGVDAAALTRTSAQRWRRLARMSDRDFLAAVEHGDGDGERRRALPAQHVVMVRTEFRADERGNMCRQVYAIEDGVGQPR
jgi:hypothetical protein